MKKIVLFLFVLISYKSFAILENVKGNGILKKEKREISGYNAIANSGPFLVDLSYGNSSSIEVEADENILPYVETKMKNNKLLIKVKKFANLKPQHAIKIHLTMTKISGIDQSGSGTITGDGKFDNDGKTTIRISGSGKIKLGIASFASAEIWLSGSGNAALTGTIHGHLNIAQSGSGFIDTEKLSADTVEINLSGSGTSRVNAVKYLHVQISGSGHVYYTGVQTCDSVISGSGSVSHI